MGPRTLRQANAGQGCKGGREEKAERKDYSRQRVFLDWKAAQEADKVDRGLADEHDAQCIRVRVHGGLAQCGL